MKILAINASHKGEKGFTQVLLNSIASGASEAGADFETVLLARQKINFCLGCEVCHTDKSYLKCVYERDDDMKMIFDKIAEADIIIYATPVYVFNMSGLMKIFIDRFNSTGDTGQIEITKKGLIFHHINKDICSKPFVLLVTCGNIEKEAYKSILSYFRIFSKFMDAPTVGTLVRNSCFILQRNDAGMQAKREAILNTFVDTGRELALSGRISKRSKRRATRDVIEIPPVIKLLMKIRPLKAKLVRLGLRRNVIGFN